MATKKGNRPLIVAIAIGVILFAILIATAPKEIDWSYSFSKNDKIPFGNKILFEVLPSIFPDQKVVTSHTTLIQFLDDTYLTNSNYIVINNEYKPDSLEMERLLASVSDGNHVFIAANDFSELFLDTFNLQIAHPFNININGGDSATYNFANRRLKTPFGYVFKKAYEPNYIESYDTAKTTVLGYDQMGHTNFISIRHGSGSFFVHCNPLLFTNYNMVSNNHDEYVFKCLSYLPVAPVIWDEYYKAKERPVGSMLSFIVKNKSLRYAWYLFLLTLVVYLVVESKRRQRIIPIIKAPVNTSLQFIETIGRLYFSRKNHHDIARKRFTYFAEFIRTNYYINLNEANSDAIRDLSAKSTIPPRTIEQIVQMGHRLNSVTHISEEDLISFNQKIEFFYHNCQ